MAVKQSENRRYKNPIIIILVILLVISIGLNLSHYSINRQQTETLEDISNELKDLKPLDSLRNLTIPNPVTRYLEGTRIASGSTLHFLRDRETNAFSGYDDIAFYVPYDNATIEMKFYLSPSEGYSQGLFLQKGNAYRNESGVLIQGNPEDQRIYTDEAGTHIHNATIWRSPVIWETEARNGERYTVLLESGGWYTLSIWSPILSSIGSLEKSGKPILMDDDSYPRPSRIESWVEFKIIKDESPVLFILKHN